MKTPTTTVYLGQPLDHPSERSFLERLRADLQGRGIPALILANFITGRTYRQVDFLIISAARTVHCELKAYTLPMIGGINGPWVQVLPDGSRRILDEGNPYRQAQETTYALSDAMRQLVVRDASVPRATNGQFFRDVDTVVCLFPNIPAGSRFDRFSYVTVVAYEQLLQRLATPGPHPSWTEQHWEAFIRSQGLYKQETRSDEERARIAARQIVDDYRRRFVAAQSAGLHEFVAVAATVDGALEIHPDLQRLVLDQQTVVVSGGSGLGKTHAARHTAVGLAQARHVPVWIRCQEYEAGGFDVLTRRAIAPYTTEAIADFMEAVRDAGSLVVLILDGLNECAAAHRQELLQETAATVLAHGVYVLMTTQTTPALPEPLGATEVVMQAPDPSEREALVRSYGADSMVADLASFTTPLELAIAAECAQSLPGVVTRAELFEEYVNRRAGSEALRAALRVIARLMDEDVRISLPVASARRILQRAKVPAEVIDEAFASPLLVGVQGRIAFCHELFGRSLAAMDLVIRARTGEELGRWLRAPQHGDLRADAISLEHDVNRARDVMRELGDASTLYSALCGELGSVAQSVATAEATGLLAEAADRTCSEMVSPVLTADGVFEEHLRLARPWSTYECALLNAAGSALMRDLFVAEVGHVLDRTDEAIEVLIDEVHVTGERAPITEVIAAIYGHPGEHSGNALAASYLVLACDWHRPTFRRVSFSERNAAAAAEFFGGVGRRSWSRLYAALLLFDPGDAASGAWLPELLSAAWNAGGYHLRLQALETAQFAASKLSEADAAGVVAMLEGLSPGHVFLSTSLVEALAAYGAIQPVNDLQSIREEVAQVLRQPDDAGACEAAHSIVMKQLEEETIFGPYMEALEELEPGDRGTLALMAARGADREGWFTHFVVEQLLRYANLRDRDVQRVVIGFASDLPAEFPDQGHLAVHLEALAACAGFLERTPEVGDPEDRRPELEAWRVFRELLFGLARQERRSLMTEVLWSRIHGELNLAAVDVLHHLSDAGVLREHTGESAHHMVIAVYPDEVRTLLEWGLLHRDELTTYFKNGDRSRRDRYMVRTLGQVGDEQTARVLRAFLGDDDLGEDVVDAIRRLEGAVQVGDR
jgi:NACHT domain/Nuclease-related domain